MDLFSYNRDEQPYFTYLMNRGVLPPYLVMLITFGFIRLVAVLVSTLVSRSFGALCSVHEHIQPRGTKFLVAFNRYGLSHIPCKVWKWVIYLVFE